MEYLNLLHTHFSCCIDNTKFGKKIIDEFQFLLVGLTTLDFVLNYSW